MLFLIHRLPFDNRNTPAAAESRGEVGNLEGPQPGRDEQVVPVLGTERVTASSARREKSFSSAVLAAVAARTFGQRCVWRLNMERTMDELYSNSSVECSVLCLDVGRFGRLKVNFHPTLNDMNFFYLYPLDIQP